MDRRIIPIVALILIFLAIVIHQNQSYPVCPDCNVIIIAFDAMQYYHTSLTDSGYHKNTTPNLADFSQQGTVFTDAISPASWTVPTYVSWFTSLYPSEHKVVNRYSVYNSTYSVVADFRKLRTNTTYTMADILKENGYATGAFTGDAGARGDSGNVKGFDVYVDKPLGFNGFDFSEPLALNWITTHKNQKFFVFLHGYDAHGQFNLQNFTGRFLNINYTGKFTGSPKEQGQLREEGLAKGYVNVTQDDVTFWKAVYDEKIYDADAVFGRFINNLTQQGLMNNTIIIVASDHGTEMFEHGRVDHGDTLYQELIHVPLVVRIPGMNSVKISNTQISILDFMPTVLDALGIKVNQTIQSQMKGQSLVQALQSKGVSRDVYSETDYRLYTHKRSIITTDGWKFIWTLAEYPNKTNVKELYNLTADPHETLNVIEEYPRVAYELEQKVAQHMKDMGTDINGPWVIGCSPVYSDQCKEVSNE